MKLVFQIFLGILLAWFAINGLERVRLAFSIQELNGTLERARIESPTTVKPQSPLKKAQPSQAEMDRLNAETDAAYIQQNPGGQRKSYCIDSARAHSAWTSDGALAPECTSLPPQAAEVL